MLANNPRQKSFSPNKKDDTTRSWLDNDRILQTDTDSIKTGGCTGTGCRFARRIFAMSIMKQFDTQMRNFNKPNRREELTSKNS